MKLAGGLFLICIMITGCVSQQRLEDYKSYLKYYNVQEPVGLTTHTCRGYGCRIIDSITLTKREWSYITAPIHKRPKSAEVERENLRWVIGRFETVIGSKNGTSADWPGTYLKLGDDQLDCSDESTNNTLYLLMLQNHGLLRYHTIGRVGGRFPPHLTAVLIEKDSGTPWAIDSWFHYNGVRAEIVPLDVWKYRWHPPQDNLRLEDVTPPKRW
jgi:hypothetical protein